MAPPSGSLALTAKERVPPSIVARLPIGPRTGNRLAGCTENPTVSRSTQGGAALSRTSKTAPSLTPASPAIGVQEKTRVAGLNVAPGGRKAAEKVRLWAASGSAAVRVK